MVLGPALSASGRGAPGATRAAPARGSGAAPLVRKTLHSPISTRRPRCRGSPLGCKASTRPREQQPPPATEQDRPETANSTRSLPHLFAHLAEVHGDRVALVDPHHPRANKQTTFRQLHEQSMALGGGLHALGLRPGSVVAQFADNSSRWLLADAAVMANGAINAVRGAKALPGELHTLLGIAPADALVLQDAELLGRLLEVEPDSAAEGPLGAAARFVVLLWGPVPSELEARCPIPVHTFEEVLEMGSDALQRGGWRPPLDSLTRDSTATLVFTSGTSGRPKAAALSHGNILYQTEQFPFYLQVSAGDTSLSVLPPWHIYERTVSYYILSQGARQVYSNVQKLRTDLPTYRPDYLVCVPLLLDVLYGRIRSRLRALQGLQKAVVNVLLPAALLHVQAKRIVHGVALEFAEEKAPWWQAALARLQAAFLALPRMLAAAVVLNKVRQELGVQKAVISGGSSLAGHLDAFYEALGLPVLNGWGMTEASPVIACRQLDDPLDPTRNIRGTVGVPIPGTTIRFVDPMDLDEEVATGEAGVALVKGPGILRQYWRDAAATEAAFHNGWFNTGDLGTVLPSGTPMAGQIVLRGRSKDTIVLSGGDNVEPQPIEDAICQSALIKHAMLLGQDRRTLGCLVCMDEEELQAHMAEQGDRRKAAELTAAELNNAMLAEVRRLNGARADRKVWETVTVVRVVSPPFSVEGGTLTQTMKVKRGAVMNAYADDVASVLDKLQ